MKNNQLLMNAVKAKDESTIFKCMRPLIYKSIKNVSFDMQQDCYQELSIEVIKTVRNQYQRESSDFTKFFKKNNLLID